MGLNMRRGLFLVVAVLCLTSGLLAQGGDPISVMSDTAARIAEYACYGIAIVLVIVAAIQAMAGERNGLMFIGGALVFGVIAMNAREIVAMLR